MGSFTECEDELLLGADHVIVDSVGQTMHRGALKSVVDAGKFKEENISATIGAGCMVSDCIAKDKTLEELTLDEFKGYSGLFEGDIYEAIDLVKCCEGRTSYGGPSEASVKNQIALAAAQLTAWEEKNA